MRPHHWIVLGCLMGGSGVALGAFGAHGLEGYLTRQAADAAADTSGAPVNTSAAADSTAAPADERASPMRRLQTFETAVRYQMYHALALVAVGAVARRTSRPRAAAAAGWLLLAGVLIFSGLLYVLVLSGARWLGAIVPIGGAAMIAGWAALAVAAAGLRSDGQ